jgi:hypothetical protein
MTAERDFILLMYNDTTSAPTPEMWPVYLDGLRTRGVFDGGSAIGPGETFRRDGAARGISDLLGGYVRVRAPNLAAVRELLADNPVFECGGTVEIRELPRE